MLEKEESASAPEQSTDTSQPAETTKQEEATSDTSILEKILADHQDAPAEPQEEAEEEPLEAATEASLTDEEDRLLRRQRISDSDRKFYEGLPPEQRRIAMQPLRENQDLLDRVYGMKPEDRKRILGQEEDKASAPHANLPPNSSHESIDRLAEMLMPDDSEIDEFERENEIGKGSAKKPFLSQARKLAALFQQTQQRQVQSEFSQRQKELQEAQESVRGRLARDFPFLKEDSKWREVVEDQVTAGTFGALLQQGVGIERAFAQAATLRAQALAFQNIQRAKQKQAAGERSLKGTSEPAKYGRSPGKVARKPITSREDILADIIAKTSD